MSSATLEKVNRVAKDAPGPVVDVTVEVMVTATQHGPQSLVAAALARLIRAVLTAVSHTETSLLEVVSAPSDLQALLTFLQKPEVIEELSKLDPLAPARVRGILRMSELYQAEGGCVSGEAAGELTRVSRQAIDKARIRKDILGLPAGKDGWTYPVWQFHNGKYLPGLREILTVLEDDGPFVQCAFLLHANAFLEGKRPFLLLREGRQAAVLNAAKAFGEHGGA